MQTYDSVQVIWLEMFTFTVFSLFVVHQFSTLTGTRPETEEDTIHENLISWTKAHFFSIL